MATASVDGITPSGQNSGPPPFGGGPFSGGPKQEPPGSPNANPADRAGQLIQGVFEDLKKSGPIFADANKQAQSDQALRGRVELGYKLYGEHAARQGGKAFSAFEFRKFIEENQRGIQELEEKYGEYIKEHGEFPPELRGKRGQELLVQQGFKFGRDDEKAQGKQGEEERGVRGGRQEPAGRGQIDAVSRPGRPGGKADEAKPSGPTLSAKLTGDKRDRVIEPLAEKLRKQLPISANKDQRKLSDLQLQHRLELAYQAYIWMDKNHSHPSEHQLYQFYLEHERDLETLRRHVEPELKAGRFPRRLLDKHSAVGLFEKLELFGLKRGGKEGEKAKGPGGAGAGPLGAAAEAAAAGAAMGPAGLMMESMGEALAASAGAALGIKSKEEKAEIAAKAARAAKVSQGPAAGRGQISVSGKGATAGRISGEEEVDYKIEETPGEVEATGEESVGPPEVSGTEEVSGKFEGKVEAEAGGEAPSAGGEAKVKVSGKVKTEVSGPAPAQEPQAPGGIAEVEVEAEGKVEGQASAAGGKPGGEASGEVQAEVETKVSGEVPASGGKPAGETQPKSAEVEAKQESAAAQPAEEGRAEEGPKTQEAGGKVEVEVERKIKITEKQKARPQGKPAQPSAAPQAGAAGKPSGKKATPPQKPPEQKSPGKRGDAMLPQQPAGPEQDTGEQAQPSKEAQVPPGGPDEAAGSAEEQLAAPEAESPQPPQQAQVGQQPSQAEGPEKEPLPQRGAQGPPGEGPAEAPAGKPEFEGKKAPEAAEPAAEEAQRPEEPPAEGEAQQAKPPESKSPQEAGAAEPQQEVQAPQAGPEEPQEAQEQAAEKPAGPEPKEEEPQKQTPLEEEKPPEQAAPQAPSQRPSASAAAAPAAATKKPSGGEGGGAAAGAQAAAQAAPEIAEDLKRGDVKAAGEAAVKAGLQVGFDRAFYYLLAAIIPSFGLAILGLDLLWLIAIIAKVKLAFWQKLVIAALTFLLGIIIVVAIAVFTYTICNQPLVKYGSKLASYFTSNEILTFCEKYNNFQFSGAPGTGDFGGGGASTGFDGPLDTGKYKDLVNKYAQQYGLDPCILDTILKKESSGGDPNAIGHDHTAPPPPVKIWRGSADGRKAFEPNNATDPFQRNSPSLYGLDWNFSHGIGLTQVTIFPSGRGSWPVWPEGKPVRIEFGKKYYVDDLLNPEISIEWTAHFLAEKEKIVGSDPYKLFKAYNGSDTYASDAMRLYNTCKSQK